MQQHESAVVDKAVRKYLAQHAEPEAARALARLPAERRFGHVLCIPAHGEENSLLHALASVPPGPCGDVLVIVVVNETSAVGDGARAANQASLQALLGSHSPKAPDEHAMTWRAHPQGALLVIDRTHSGVPLPEAQGVGLARKIAADVALALWADGRIHAPWIHCSDADVLFPTDYFARAMPPPADDSRDATPAACIYDFLHLPEQDLATARAALRYEIFLRYYVLGLRSAGSRYAFHTIGSTLALAPLAYARARGFPRRAAAEDFHLLAKLAKLGAIVELRGEPILLSGRVSNRVPFGTGAGIAKALARSSAGKPFPAYDPRIFEWLRVWLRTLDALGANATTNTPGLRDILAAQANASMDVDADALYEALDELGAIRAAESGRVRGTRHLHERFDALRTLRFVHHLRDRRFPSFALETALREAAFIEFDGDDDLVTTRAALASSEATQSRDAAACTTRSD
jgi:hypothetical protein